MDLVRIKLFLQDSGLASEFALLAGIIVLAGWMFLSPNSSFGIGIWIGLFSIAASFFLAGFTPFEGHYHGLSFETWTVYLKRFFGISTSVAFFGYLEWRNGRNEPARPEILLFFLAAQLSLSLLVQASEPWMMIIFAEGFSFAAYGLAKPMNSDKNGSEALLKYFATGALATAVGIFGMTWILGFQGTIMDTNGGFFESIAFFPVAGAIFFMAFLLFKLGAFPFHFWVPGVFEEAPTPVSGYLAAAPKVAAAFAMLQLVAEVEANLTIPLILLAGASILLGNLAALGTLKVKSLLAFSAIGQSGLLLIPAVFSRMVSGADLHLVVLAVGYAVAVQGAFSTVQYFENHLRDDLVVSDLSGAFKNHPLPCILFLIQIIALAGMPPTIGFTGKLLVFSGILGGINLLPHVFVYLLFGLGVLSTLLSMAYLFRFPYEFLFKPGKWEDHTFRNSSASLFWMFLVGLFLILAFFKPTLFFPLASI
jgi:NADH-quinone oxidoreductase subunit N